MEYLIDIPGRLHSVATEKHVAGTDQIYDDFLKTTLDILNLENITDVKVQDGKLLFLNIQGLVLKEISIASEQKQSDWNLTDSTQVDFIKGKPTVYNKLEVDDKLITKQDTISDLAAIRSGAQAGAMAYQKPTTGIPTTDLSSAVQVSLGKADTALQEHQSLAGLVNTGSYNTVSKKIELKHDNTVLAEIDATAFIKDGMVSSVTISNGYLVITFNTDAGKEPISIALTDIFNPSNYYNKTAVNELLSNKVDKINGKGLSTEDYTTAEKTKLGDLPTSAELTTALAGKANTDVATTSANGLMSKEDKALLDDVGESMTETITDSIVIDDYTTADTSVSSENIQSEGTVSIETVDTSRGINNTIDGVTYTRGIRFSSNGDVFDVDAGGTLVLYLTAIASADKMTYLKVFFTSADGTIVNQQLKEQGWYDEIIYAHKESVTIPKAGTVSIQWYFGSSLGYVFGYLFRIDLNGSTLINVSDLKDAVSSNTALLGEKANTADLANVATSGSYNDLSDKPDLSAFITKSVNDLTNYYLKSETYTKAEVQQLIGAIQQFHYEVYPTLPQTGASNVLYLIGPTGTGADKYEEYVYANNDWTKIGDTSIDLSGYVTTEALTTALADYVTSSALSVILANTVAESGVYDVTANNNNAKFASLSALLSSENLDTLIPSSKRKGGMSIKFVQSSDNKYVSFRLMANEWSINTEDWAIVDGGVYVKNPEFVRVYTDSEDKILWAIKVDGDIYFGAGVPTQVKDYIQSKISELSLDKYEDIVTFLGSLIEGDTLSTLLNAKANASDVNTALDTKVDKVTGKSLIDAEYASSQSTIESPEFIDVTLDAERKVISYRKPSGTVVENVGIETKSIKSESYNFSDKNAQEIKDALNRIGFTTKTPSDHSNQDSIQIPEPYLAVINITNDKGEAFWPTTKTTDAKYWMEFYDGNGNYFKKRIIFNAQGNSSLFFDKKNGSIDICNDEWKGDDTCNIRFGNWTACDSFHLKSYYFDLFKGNGVIAYKIANQIMESRDFNENRPWKKELISADDKDATKVGNPSYSSLDDISLQIDNGARCVPDGFPAIVFLNSEFYGIYAFTYKKHRSNYNMDKATPEHIHLDGGELTSRTIFGGTVSWANFEIRNPKYLVYMTPRNTSFDPTNAKQVKKAYQYDADVSQAEIAGTDSPLTFDVATTYTFGQIVLYNNRQYMAMRETTGNTPTQNKKPKNVYDDAAANGYWIDITYTNKVKQYIIDLSNRMSQITSAVNPKEELQKYFDLDNIVDYELYVTLTHNIDAQGFNWQLCSWNGERWYFCVWDAERVWGQVNTFNYLDSVPSEGTLLYGNSAGTPNAWVNDNCKSELKQRWTELVSQKIADKEHIICLIKDWMDRVGSYFYEKEYEKWPLSPCNRDSKFNKTSWKLLGQHSFELPEWNQERTYYEGNETREGINIYKALSANTNKKPSDNPSVWELLSYKEGVQYNVGDRLIVGSDFTYEVECIESTSESPLLGSYSGYPADLGYHDNIWRLYDYISKWIDNLNIYFNSLNV